MGAGGSPRHKGFGGGFWTLESSASLAVPQPTRGPLSETKATARHLRCWGWWRLFCGQVGGKVVPIITEKPLFQPKHMSPNQGINTGQEPAPLLPCSTASENSPRGPLSSSAWGAPHLPSGLTGTLEGVLVFGTACGLR